MARNSRCHNSSNPAAGDPPGVIGARLRLAGSKAPPDAPETCYSPAVAVVQLLHITSRPQWDRARFAGSYRGDTLDTEGFIHCSTTEQVVRVANARFRGRDDLVLLCIDSSLVQAPIQFDAVPTGERFPHIYGPLNADAVTRTLPFPAGPDGLFSLPDELATGG